MELCEKLDRALGRARLWVVAGVAAFVAGVDWLAPGKPGHPSHAGTWGALALLWTLFLVLIGWLSGFRDNDGNWDLGPLRESITAWREGLSERRSDAWLWASVLGGLGITGLSMTQVLRLVNVVSFGVWERTLSDYAQSSQQLGLIVFIPALALAFAGTLGRLERWLSPRTAVQKGPVLAGAPLWISRAELRTSAAQVAHPVLRDLLTHIDGWPKRKRQYETVYCSELQRHLLRRVKRWRVDREKPIAVKLAGMRGRADLIIEDTLLLELKRSLITGTSDRAVGQIKRYCDVWTRGPVILVLIESIPPEQKARLHADMHALRSTGRQVLVLELGT